MRKFSDRLLVALATSAFVAVSAVGSAAQPDATPVSLAVPILDMQAEAPQAVSGKAAEQSRDGVVLVFEGIESARVTEVVRVAAADAIAHGYKVNGAILTRAATEPRVLVYGIEGAPFGPAILVTDLLEKHVTARAHELGVTRLGGHVPQASANTTAKSGEAAAVTGERKKCRVERTTGSRVRQTRYCISDKDSRAQRDAMQNTQDRGASNTDDRMGGG